MSRAKNTKNSFEGPALSAEHSGTGLLGRADGDESEVSLEDRVLNMKTIDKVNGSKEGDSKGAKTKIPIPMSRQSVEQVKKAFQAKETQKSFIPIPRTKMQYPEPVVRNARNKPTIVSVDNKDKNKDDFDKLFEEMQNKQDITEVIDSSLIRDTSLLDPDLVDDFFEEIIHSYGDEEKIKEIKDNIILSSQTISYEEKKPSAVLDKVKIYNVDTPNDETNSNEPERETDAKLNQNKKYNRQLIDTVYLKSNAETIDCEEAIISQQDGGEDKHDQPNVESVKYERQHCEDNKNNKANVELMTYDESVLSQQYSEEDKVYQSKIESIDSEEAVIVHQDKKEVEPNNVADLAKRNEENEKISSVVTDEDEGDTNHPEITNSNSNEHQETIKSIWQRIALFEDPKLIAKPIKSGRHFSRSNSKTSFTVNNTTSDKTENVRPEIVATIERHDHPTDNAALTKPKLQLIDQTNNYKTLDFAFSFTQSPNRIKKFDHNEKDINKISVVDNIQPLKVNKVAVTDEMKLTYPTELLNIGNSISIAETELKIEETSEIKVINDNALTKDIEENKDSQRNVRKFKSSSNLNEELCLRNNQSAVGIELDDSIQGRVGSLLKRVISNDRLEISKEAVVLKEMPKKANVLKRIAMFENKPTPVKTDPGPTQKLDIRDDVISQQLPTPDRKYKDQIDNLKKAKILYPDQVLVPTVELNNGIEIPVIAFGTGLLEPVLIPHVIGAAIDLGYRAFDTAFIYGNENLVGQGIRAKIDDGTVKREDLFIMNKLWSTFHRPDLVEAACRNSLTAMGLDYFDLYMIHNPMTLKEGGDPLPKIAKVLQYSTFDYLDAWYAMEGLVRKRLVRSIGVSNFNSAQITRIVDKGKIRPVVNQVESHPYMKQLRLDLFCGGHHVKLSCYATLGSKDTPAPWKNAENPVIEDAVVARVAEAAGRTPAQVLIRYQLDQERTVVVKTSQVHHLWENLQAVTFKLTPEQVETLDALNRNKRFFTFKGLGDTHKNYPFNIPF